MLKKTSLCQGQPQGRMLAGESLSDHHLAEMVPYLLLKGNGPDFDLVTLIYTGSKSTDFSQVISNLSHYK